MELAAELHAKHSGVPLLPEGGGLPPADGSDDASLAAAFDALPLAPTVALDAFISLMEGALQMRRGPRAYLVPSPSAKYNPEPTFRPAINQRSRELAARLRPADVETYEILYAAADVARAKLEAARRANEEAELKDCTFAPVMIVPSNGVGPGAVEGRALKQAARPPAPTPRSGSTTPRTPGGAAGKVQEQQRQRQVQHQQQYRRAQEDEYDDDDEEGDEQFLALEREVREALAAGSSLQLGGGSGSITLPEVTAALRAQMGGTGGAVDPLDLRATEEMLLNLLGGEDQEEGEEEVQQEERPRFHGSKGGVSGLEELASELGVGLQAR